MSALLIFSLFLIILLGYSLYKYQGLPLYQAILLMVIFIVIISIPVYVIYKVGNRKNTKEDDGREKEVLEDVVNVRKGRYLNTKSSLGRWYLSAIIFIILFPILVKLVNIPEIVIIYGGLFLIILFVTGVVLTNRKN